MNKTPKQNRKRKKKKRKVVNTKRTKEEKTNAGGEIALIYSCQTNRT